MSNKKFDKVLENLNKITSFKEALEWDDDLALKLINDWKRDFSLIKSVPNSMRASYMATYLPPSKVGLIYSLTNWLSENGAIDGNIF
jgi:hypothetical protein